MVRGPLFFQEGQHMCGIAGMIDFEKDLREREKILLEMQSALRRRGPD